MAEEFDKFDLLATAKRRRREQIAGRSREIHIPEWDLVIHVRPKNLIEHARTLEIARSGNREELADLIVLRAMTKDGAPMFQPAHVREIRALDADVIDRVAASILDYDAEMSAEAAPGETLAEAAQKN